MKIKIFILLLTFIHIIPSFAQLEVKEESFKEVPGFVNINTDKMYDDNDKPYAVLKIRTENINNKQRRELVFEGDAATYFELEYNVGEIWVYLSYYATFLKISHPDLSSTEFWFPFDMAPKKGYELTLVNRPPIDEELVKRIEKLEGAYNNVAANEQVVEQEAITTKLLNGVFSVSEDKKVCFSQGNLQYSAATNTWRFAENQWDYIGGINGRISKEYSMWIDLFGWGTSNDPSMFSIQCSDYYIKFFDWGIHKIINGGDKRWMTLNKSEWLFLLEKRATISGIRYAKAIVNGINGLILLPDDWNTNIYDLNYANTQDALFGSNNISLSTWTDILEKNGAVFLPASGYRHGESITYDGYQGYYWSATSCLDADFSYGVYFNDKKLKPSGKYYRFEGRSVRLVCNVSN